ncbi:MAG: hypothetical protein NTZ16_04780 [Verrucomicrobia bacterium]|nr:hypothetical protein [Verrucomicrobiota bacterium]
MRYCQRIALLRLRRQDEMLRRQSRQCRPGSTAAQKDFQAALWLVVHATASVAAPDNRVAATSVAPASARAVPLFTRDCAYLI